MLMNYEAIKEEIKRFIKREGSYKKISSIEIIEDKNTYKAIIMKKKGI